MVDKLLTESAWTGLARKRELDDAALLKALARLARAGDDAVTQADALESVEGEAKKLTAALGKRKDAKELKDLRGRLAEMLAAAERARKEAATRPEPEADEDTPALLTTKMVPLLRELRKGELQLHALIASAAKDAAVLIMRREIAPARRKLLAAQLEGTPKYFAGRCFWENNALVFVVDGAAAGLAKKVKAALLAQLDLRLKVRVRGVDGSEEAEGDDEEGAAGEVPEAPPEPPRQAAPAAVDAAFMARLAALLPRVKEALAARHAQAAAARTGVAEAGALAKQGRLDEANRLLDAIERALVAPATPAGDAEAPFGALAADLRQARRALRAARDELQAAAAQADQQVRRLQATLAISPDEDLRAIAGSSDIGLNALTGNHRVRLMAALFELDDAGSEQLAALLPRARTLAQRMRAHVASDARVAACDDNPFNVPVNVRGLLDPALGRVEQAIAAFAA